MEASSVLRGFGVARSTVLDFNLDRPNRRSISFRFHNNFDWSDKAHLTYYHRSTKVITASSKSPDKKKNKDKIKKMKEKTVGEFSTENKLKLLKCFSMADPLTEDAGEVFLKRFEEIRAEEEREKSTRLMDSSSSSSSSSSESSSSCERVRNRIRKTKPLEAIERKKSSNCVEVCMGNKCKKSGGEALMAEFERQNVNVVACNKCMGKCKSAPNVRLQNNGTQMAVSMDPLRIGIGVGEELSELVEAFLQQSSLQPPFPASP